MIVLPKRVAQGCWGGDVVAPRRFGVRNRRQPSTTVVNRRQPSSQPSANVVNRCQPFVSDRCGGKMAVPWGALGEFRKSGQFRGFQRS